MNTYGAKGFEWAVKTEDRNALWQARNDVALSIPAYAVGTR